MSRRNKEVENRLDEPEAVRETQGDARGDGVPVDRGSLHLPILEADHRRDHERLHLALESGDVGLWDYDLHTGEVLWSHTLYDLLQRDRTAPITADTFFEYIHEDDRPRVREHAQAWFASGGEFADEFRIVRDDGEVRWFAARGRIHLDDQGRPLRAMGVNYDVTDRERMEERLRESEERLRLAARAAKFGIYDADLVSGELFWSPEMWAILGVADGMTLKRPGEVPDFVHPDDVGGVREMLDRAFDPAGDGTVFDEHRIVRPDGSVRWVQVRGQVEFAGDGAERRPVRSRGMVLDITARKRSEQALREFNDTLEQRVAERTAQVRAKARQLRALAAQLSQVEQRERKRLARVLHDHIQQLIVGARLELSAVESSSDIDKVQATIGKVGDILREALEASRSLTVDLSPPVLHEAGLIGGLSWLCSRMKETNRFTVHLRADSEAEPAAEDVRLLLFEGVRELLFNTLKHGGVTEAEIALMRADSGHIHVIVSDQGRGFDPEVLTRRGSDETTFGLFSIQERLAHLGGRMDIASAPNQGTRITLTVPVSAAVASPQPAPRPSEPISTSIVEMRSKEDLLRVLIVDDHKILREGLAGLLRFQPDMEVVGEACDGPEAIELAERLQPDVIVMDVNLGEMSGVEATGRIVSRHPQIRVIGLSMHVDEDVAAAMRQAGASAYLTKSGQSGELIETIRACRGDTQPRR